jgi:ribosomal protein S1
VRGGPPPAPPCRRPRPPAVGDTVSGVVSRIESYGAFVNLLPAHGAESGLVHISELAGRFVTDVRDCVCVGDVVRVKLLARDERGRLSLSVKCAEVTGYALVVRMGGDGGHPWNDGGQTRWADLGPRCAQVHNPWEADPALFTFDHTTLPPPPPRHPPYPTAGGVS